MAGQRRIHAAALFRVTDMWGPLSGGSRLSATGEYRIGHLFTDLVQYLKFDKLGYVDSKIVK